MNLEFIKRSTFNVIINGQPIEVRGSVYRAEAFGKTYFFGVYKRKCRWFAVEILTGYECSGRKCSIKRNALMSLKEVLYTINKENWDTAFKNVKAELGDLYPVNDIGNIIENPELLPGTGEGKGGIQ